MSVKQFKQKNAEWPPRIFKCDLEELLKDKLGDKYSIVNVSAYLGITPVTMKNILRGGTISLENAMKLALFLEKDIQQIWTLRK
jgi:plasmid maintenance system antidote protein VapI